MNNNVKISLSITLQGSTLVRQEDFETVVSFDKKKNKRREKKVKSYSLVAKPAIISKQMTAEAYDYFTSMDSCPGFKKKEWKKMTPTQRLEHHLADLCKFYKGIKYTYQVFEE